MNVNELKPCPFCDVMPEMDKGIVHCHSCASDVFADNWQDRPIEDALRAEIADIMHKWNEGAEAQRRVIDGLEAEIAALKYSIKASEQIEDELLKEIAALKAQHIARDEWAAAKEHEIAALKAKLLAKITPNRKEEA